MARLIRAFLLAGVSVLALSTPALADPGTLIITALTSTAFAASTAGLALAGAINLAAAIGLSLVVGGKQPDQPKPQDVQGVVRQSIPARWRHYGLRRLGGPLMFIETQNGGLNQVVAFASHQVDGVQEWIIDNRHVVLDGAGGIITDPYDPDQQGIEYRLGQASQTAYASLVAKFPTIWTAAHRGNGIFHAHLRTDPVDADQVSEVYPNRTAVLNAVTRCALVYDPRYGDTAYGARPGVPGALQRGTNLALILRDFLTHDDGFQIDPAYVDDADFIAAANACDVKLTNKAGGTTPRYHGALSYSFDAEPKSALDRIIRASDGRLCLKPNGKIGFSVGVWSEPTVTLTDEHVIDYQLSDGGGPLREFNEIRLKYEEPLADFAQAEAQPWRREDEISTYGEVRSTTIEAYEIQNHNHARRIQKIVAARAAPRWQGTLTTGLFGMNAWDQRFIRVQLPDMDAQGDPFDETMEVQDIGLDFETMIVTIQVASFGSDAYAFDAATEEGAAPTIPDQLEEGALPAMTGFTVTSLQRTVSGSTKVPTLRAAWSYPGRKDLTAEVEYSIADQEDWNKAAVANGALKTDIVGVEDGPLYDVRGRWRGSSGAVGPWTVAENILGVADPTAPGTPTAMQAANSGGTVSVSARAGNDNTTYLVFKRGTAGQTYAQATTLQTLKATANQVLSISDAPAAGATYRYWVGARNGSGVEASNPAFADVEIAGPELVTNGVMASDTGWTKSTGVTIASGVMTKAAGTAGITTQTLAGGALPAATYRYAFDVSGYSAGTVYVRLTGGAGLLTSPVRSANGTYTGTFTASGQTVLGIVFDAAAALSIDNVSLKRVA